MLTIERKTEPLSGSLGITDPGYRNEKGFGTLRTKKSEASVYS
jgi:hypothetical protein